MPTQFLINHFNNNIIAHISNCFLKCTFCNNYIRIFIQKENRKIRILNNIEPFPLIFSIITRCWPLNSFIVCMHILTVFFYTLTLKTAFYFDTWSKMVISSLFYDYDPWTTPARSIMLPSETYVFKLLTKSFHQFTHLYLQIMFRRYFDIRVNLIIFEK